MASRIVGIDVPRIELDGHGLDSDTVTLIADGEARVEVPQRAFDEVERSWRRACELVADRRVYGRSTGVGANRVLDVDLADLDLHGLRLLRSHAGGIGEPLPARQVRAMSVVRLNQLLVGGAGLRLEVARTLAAAIEAGVHPLVNEYGAVGTGDLAALSQLGLALAGEHPWLGDCAPPPAIKLETGDALALISSNALTLGQASLARHDLDRLLRATHVVAALSLLAVEGSLEAFAEPVHLARPHPGNLRAAFEVRRLVGAPARPAPPAGRIQDPYGLRCFPQIHGPALEAADALERVLAIELNAGVENPLISGAGPDGGLAAYHHGGFYSAHLALALDQLGLALLPTARMSAARLAALNEPGITGLRPFLAGAVSAGSGVLILEYSANAAIAELRNAATPASTGHAVLSRGVEEAASFASQAARQVLRAVEAYRLVLGCELVAAVRALRQREEAKAAWLDLSLPVGRAYALAEATLDQSMEDRPLTADVSAAAGLLDALAEL